MEIWAGVLFGKMKQNKITQQDIAGHLGITRQYVSMVFNGKHKPKDAEARFNAAVDEIIGRKR